MVLISGCAGHVVMGGDDNFCVQHHCRIERGRGLLRVKPEFRGDR
jgi:hypothetical protein